MRMTPATRWLAMALAVTQLWWGAAPLGAQEQEEEVKAPQVRRVDRQAGNAVGPWGATRREIGVGYVQGVDNNVFLNSKRKSSGFSQENLDVTYAWPLLDEGSLIIEDRLTNINYYSANEANLINNKLNLTTEWTVLEDHRLRLGTYYDFVWRPNDRDAIYNELGGVVSLRQPLVGRHYHEIDYQLFTRRYYARHALSGTRVPSDDRRLDRRHTLEHILGLWASPKTLIKYKNRFYTNNSNDQFHDFYDVWTWRTSLSILQSLTKQLVAMTGFGYEFRNYYSRRVSGMQNTEEDDNLWMANAAVVYTHSPQLSLSYTYAYRENHSNAPISEYSGSVNTVGIHYTF